MTKEQCAVDNPILTAKLSKMYVDGFKRSRARWWLGAKDNVLKNDDMHTSEEKAWALSRGFVPSIVKRYGIDEDNIDDFVSLKDYAFIYPINDIFKKWLADRVTTRKILKPFKDHLLNFYFHLYIRDDDPMVVKLDDCPEQYPASLEGVLEMLRDRKALYVMKTYGLDYDTITYVGPPKKGETAKAATEKVVRNFACTGWEEDDEKEMKRLVNLFAPIDDEWLCSHFTFNGKKMTGAYLLRELSGLARLHVRAIVDIPEADKSLDFGSDDYMTVVRTIVVNEFADNPEVKQAYIRIAKGKEEWDVELAQHDEADLIGKHGERLEEKSLEQIINDIDSDYVAYSFLEDERVNESRMTQFARSYNVYVPVDIETGEYDGALRTNAEDDLIELKASEENGRPFKGTVPHWDEIKKTLVEIGHFIPQIEIMEVDVFITKDGFVFADFNDHPFYPQTVGFNEEMTRYLKMKVTQAHEDKGNKERAKKMFQKGVNGLFWSYFTRLLAPPEMRPLIYKWWYKTMIQDLKSNNGLTLAQKKWAYDRGFLSYRIKQYGLNDENYKDYISDYDYRYLRHINNKYRTWLEDKITVKYICSEYPEFFPKYYYHVSVRNGEKRVIPLMDAPSQSEASLDAVFDLVKKEGSLACKPQKGSQGDGFYKLSYEDGKYFMNHEPATREEILEILGDPESQYLITEYIKQHPLIDDIYSGAVNTMRVISFMKDGKTPQIGNAYMRFGSTATGAVDNMGAGGMTVEIDEKTGRFFNAMMITDNTIIPIDKHPDTGAPMEGYIPHWDEIVEGIKELHRAMPELEYLGFDVAITEDGMRLPEINRAPGLPKIESLNRETIDYLLYKKDKKMERVGIDKTKF